MTYFFEILSAYAAESNGSQDLVKVLSAMTPPATASITALGTIRNIRGIDHASTADANGHEPVADLTHDDAPISTPCDRGTHSREFRLPVGADLVCERCERRF